MYTQKTPSLFLPKLAVLLFVAIFLTGMAEVVCLATFAGKSDYSIANETSKLIQQTGKSQAPATRLIHQSSVN